MSNSTENSASATVPIGDADRRKLATLEATAIEALTGMARIVATTLDNHGVYNSFTIKTRGDSFEFSFTTTEAPRHDPDALVVNQTGGGVYIDPPGICRPT